MSKTQTIILYVTGALLAVGLGILAALYTGQAGRGAGGLALEGGTALGDNARELPAFELTDHEGRPFTRESLKGRWTFLFFGYTHCPDVCPTTLQAMAMTLKAIKPGERPVGGMFISVDPERDTQERLAQYPSYFHPAIGGATAEMAKLKQLTGPLGVLHAKVADPRSDDNYLVDHSASILLIDPDGRLGAVFGAPHDPTIVARDFERVRAFYQKTH